VIKRIGPDILLAVARGVALPNDRLPSYPAPRRFVKEKQKGEILKRLKQWREGRACELGIEAGILVNNGVLEAVAETALRGEDAGEPVISLKHWQDEAFGQELRKFAHDIDGSA
jgi:ribonuclease D